MRLVVAEEQEIAAGQRWLGVEAAIVIAATDAAQDQVGRGVAAASGVDPATAGCLIFEPAAVVACPRRSCIDAVPARRVHVHAVAGPPSPPTRRCRPPSPRHAVIAVSPRHADVARRDYVVSHDSRAVAVAQHQCRIVGRSERSLDLERVVAARPRPGLAQVVVVVVADPGAGLVPVAGGQLDVEDVHGAVVVDVAGRVVGCARHTWAE